MSPAPAPRTHAAVHERPPVPRGDRDDPGFTPRGGAERPPSLREVIVRWLNAEL